MSNYESAAPRTLKTLVTAWAVLEGLIELDGAGVTELATHLDRSKSTIYPYLQTLEELELITKNGAQYQLSFQHLLLGEYVRNNSLLFQLGYQAVDELADDLGQYAHLVAEENGRGVILHHAMGDHAVEYDYQRRKLQHRDPLHMTASGKAILASLPKHRVADIIDQYGLDQSTTQTITDPERLYAKLETIRERGYAVNDQEEIAGFRAVAAPICPTEADILGAVTVSGPTSVFDASLCAETLPDKVRTTANSIEVSINMQRKRTQ